LPTVADFVALFAPKKAVAKAKATANLG
jgi:hypothetical protein